MISQKKIYNFTTHSKICIGIVIFIYLISLIVYKYNTNVEIIEREIKELNEKENKIEYKNIKFGYVFRKEDNIKESIVKHKEGWDKII